MIKLTFGMIVFNAGSTLPKGMLEKCILNVYPHAHEIIIVEGASNGGDGSGDLFTPDGRSTDNTIEIIKSIPDSGNKIRLFAADAFWNGKTAMCNHYARYATGNVIWHLDNDEFYFHDDIEFVHKMLDDHKEVASVHFYAENFFGGYDYSFGVDAKNWANQTPWKRVFRHAPGSRFASHEPPAYLYRIGTSVYNMDKLPTATREDMMKDGIKLYHYSMVCENQVMFKTRFYSRNDYLVAWKDYKKDPQSVELFGDKLSKFEGKHPLGE